MPMYTPWKGHQCPCPHSDPQSLLASPGDPLRPAGRAGPGSYEIAAFALGPSVHNILCVPYRNGVSVSLSPTELLH